MRTAAKVDGTHRAIVEALERVGCSVLSLAAVGKGAPDLLVGYRGRNTLVEVKDTTTRYGRRGLNPAQRVWAESWRGESVAVVSSVDQALALVLE